MREEILRMSRVIDAAEGSSSLQCLSIQIFKGEIYGLLCLERHGLSKMIDLICWNRALANGQVFFCEKLVNSVNQVKVTKNKVSIVGRQCRLIDGLTLADNVFVCREGFRRHIIPERAMQLETARLLRELEIDATPDTMAEELSAYHRIVLEILKAVIAGNQLIILWELSDLLSSEELPRFHRLIQTLAHRGSTFLYIYSHHEVLCPVCDRIAIFKGCTIQKVFSDQDRIREQILNVYAADAYDKLQKMGSSKEPNQDRPEILHLEHLSHGAVSDFGLTVRKGENILLLDQSNSIIGDLVELFLQMEAGRTPGSLCRKRHIAVLQRDPVATMLFPELSYLENLCFLLAEKVPLFWQRRKLQQSVYKEFWAELGPVMKAPSLYGLSKQQLYTLVYYRFLLAKPDLLVCVQPLSNLDIHLRSHILELLSRLQRNGIAVLVLNTELYDTIYIADRLIRVEQGKIVEQYTREQFETLRLTHQSMYPD